MDKNELLKHKRNLISIYTKNLQALEVRQAHGAFDLSLVNQIDNIKMMIFQLEEDIGKTTTASAPYSLIFVPFPLQKYESFITKFAEELSSWNGDPARYEMCMLTSLKRASGAKYVFIAKYSGDWSVTAENDEASREVGNLLSQSGPLRELLLQSTNQDNLIIGILADSTHLCLLLPIKEDIQKVMVFYEIKADTEYDKGIELILQTILKHTDNLNGPLLSELLEQIIYNALKEKFGYVSDAMYSRQFYLFNKQLERMAIHFEPIIFLSPSAPSIFGWEALARDEKTHAAPLELFHTAELWGARFQLQLDMYFLKKAVDTYVIEHDDADKKHKYRRKHTLLPLAVNVHPASLIRTRYYETVKNIEELGHMPLNKLYFEISEKLPIPMVEDCFNENQHPIDAYREFLYRFRDLDIHFSVDDFGVGFASSARISRLGPAFVKIDRDALLDNFGNFTLEYVIKLAKRMPGEMRVIVEGFDKDSKFSLNKLYNIGVRYIQGHKYGLTRPYVDDRLPLDIVQEIKNDLKGCK